MAKTDVLVMIDFTFLCFVRQNLLPLSAVNLLIFDECHHAAGNHHPMRDIMECYQEIKKKSSKLPLPRIVGLTASVFIGHVSKRELPYRVKLLEDVLDAKLVAPRDTKSVTCYCTQPTEEVISYASNQLFENQKTALSRLHMLIGEIMNFGQSSNLMRQVQDIIDVTIELGDWCCALMIEYEIQQCTIYQHLLPINIKNLLLQRYCEILSFLREPKGQLMPMCHASSKVKCLLDKLRQVKFGASGIIFVATRNKAKLLCALLQKAAQEDPKLEFLVPLHVTGHGYGKGPELTLGNADLYQCNRNVTLDMFRNGECNFLVSTNFIEEGINVQHCNLIVRFDLPETYRSYVQSRGRARALSSKYVMMTEKSHMGHFNLQLTLYRDIESSLQELCKSRQPPADVFNQTELDMKLPSDSETIPEPTGERDQVVEGCAELSVHFSFTLKEKGQVLTPQFQYWYRKGGEIRAELKLPKNACMNQVVHGEWEKTKSLADQSAILALCRVLSDISLQKPNSKLLGTGLKDSTKTAKSSKPLTQDKTKKMETDADQSMVSTSDDTAQKGAVRPGSLGNNNSAENTVVISTVNMDDAHHVPEKKASGTRPLTPGPLNGALDVNARRPDELDATLVFDDVNNVEGTVHRNANNILDGLDHVASVNENNERSILKDGMASGVVCKKEHLSISRGQNHLVKSEMNENEPIIKKEPEDEEIFMLKSLVEKGDIICVDLSDSMDVDFFSSDEEADMDLNSVFATLDSNKNPVTEEGGSPSILSNDNQKPGLMSNDFPGNSDVVRKKGTGNEHDSFDELLHHPSTSKLSDLSRKEGKGNSDGKKDKYKLPEIIKYSTSNPGDLNDGEEYSPFDELINSSSTEGPNTDMKKKGDHPTLTCDKVQCSSTPKREVDIDGVDHEERLSNAFDDFMMRSSTPTLETGAHMVKNSSAIDKLERSSRPKLKTGTGVVSHEEKLSSVFDKLLEEDTSNEKKLPESTKDDDLNCTFDKLLEGGLRDEKELPENPDVEMIERESDTNSTFDEVPVLKSPSTRPTLQEDDIKMETIEDSQKIVDYSASEETNSDDDDIHILYDKWENGIEKELRALRRNAGSEATDISVVNEVTNVSVVNEVNNICIINEDNDIKVICEKREILSGEVEVCGTSNRIVCLSPSGEINNSESISPEIPIAVEFLDALPTGGETKPSVKERASLEKTVGSKTSTEIDTGTSTEIGGKGIALKTEDSAENISPELLTLDGRDASKGTTSEMSMLEKENTALKLSPESRSQAGIDTSALEIENRILKKSPAVGDETSTENGALKTSPESPETLREAGRDATIDETVTMKMEDSALLKSPELKVLCGNNSLTKIKDENSNLENVALKMSTVTSKTSQGTTDKEVGAAKSSLLSQFFSGSGKLIKPNPSIKINIALKKTPPESKSKTASLPGTDIETRNSEIETSNSEKANLAIKMSPGTQTVNKPSSSSTLLTETKTNASDKELPTIKISPGSRNIVDTPKSNIKKELMPVKLSPEPSNIVKRSKSGKKNKRKTGVIASTSNAELMLPVKLSPGSRNSENTNILKKKSSKKSLGSRNTTSSTSTLEKELKIERLSPRITSNSDDKGTHIKTSGSRDTDRTNNSEAKTVNLSSASRNATNSDKKGTHIKTSPGSRDTGGLEPSTSNSEKGLKTVKFSPGSRNAENTNNSDKRTANTVETNPFINNSGNKGTNTVDPIICTSGNTDSNTVDANPFINNSGGKKDTNTVEIDLGNTDSNTVETDPILSTPGKTDSDSEPPGGAKGSKAATKLWIEGLETPPSDAQKRESSEESEDPASKKIKLELLEESQEYY